MKQVAVGIILMSTAAVAADIGIPAIEDMPILRIDTPTYYQASAAFQKALFMQVGIAEKYNVVKGFVNQKADEVTSKVTSETVYVVDTYSPIDSNTLFFTAGFGYALLVKKQVSKSFRNPLLLSMTHNIAVTPDTFSTGINLSF